MGRGGGGDGSGFDDITHSDFTARASNLQEQKIVGFGRNGYNTLVPSTFTTKATKWTQLTEDYAPAVVHMPLRLAAGLRVAPARTPDPMRTPTVRPSAHIRACTSYKDISRSAQSGYDKQVVITSLLREGEVWVACNDCTSNDHRCSPAGSDNAA
jgi:hypothetical protein